MPRRVMLLEFLGMRARGESLEDVVIPGLEANAKRAQQVDKARDDRIDELKASGVDPVVEQRKLGVSGRFGGQQIPPDQRHEAELALLAYLKP